MNCLVCGNKLRYGRKFCSRSCAGIASATGRIRSESSRRRTSVAVHLYLHRGEPLKHGDWYYRRKEQAIQRLGGKCVRCGSHDNLEFDHINPRTRTINLTMALNFSEDIFERELAKCQLLCHECHVTKTKEDRLKVKFGQIA